MPLIKGFNMPTQVKTEANIQQAVPFFGVTNMEASLRFYVDGLGFEMTKQWIDEGKLRWCWLQHGNAAIMLQEFRASRKPEGKLGIGVSICFQCKDALAIYKEATARGIAAQRPFVGNAMWVTIITDPDGYKLDFESCTDAPEESLFTEA
jgi:lactoylglutathione lyase